jgi:hypothetical protein
MKRFIAVAVSAAALLAFGCATGYQSADDSITGGLTETRLTPTTWRVLVQGNGFTSRGEAEQILMRRAAELTLEQGKRYFVLSQHEAWTRQRLSSSGHIISAPMNASVVIAVDQNERDAFDAVKIVQETDEVAEGRLSAKAKKTLSELGE